MRSVLTPRTGNSVKTCVRYAHGLNPCRYAEAVTLSTTAVVFNPPSPAMWSQFFRPMASGRMACSAAALSIVSLPSVRYTPRVSHWFVAYVTASPMADFGSTRGR